MTFAERNAPTPRFGSLYRSLIVSVALPLIVVQVLLRRGVPAVEALAIAAIFPLADTLIGLVRARRVDPIVVLSLLALVAGLATSGLSGNAAFAVAKDSLFTTVFGLVFLGSLLTRRPLIFQLGRQYSTGNDPVAMADWDARWERALFRRTIRIMTAVWGCALLIEAVLRILAAFALPVATSTIVSPVLQVGIVGGLFLWTSTYAKAVRRRVAAVADTDGT
ncbi:MAG TPA: VC0807 family protein [Candidatus Elarobacter sp.]